MPDLEPKRQQGAVRRPAGSDPAAPGGGAEAPAEAGDNARPESLLQRLVGFLGGQDDAERQRRRVLREYARRVQRSRPRLYNTRSSTVEPALGTVFHSFYRVLGPARILLRNAALSSVLKSVTVERALSERQRELLASLSEEALTAKAQSQESGAYVEGVRSELKALVQSFDRKTVQRSRRAYRAVMVLVDLVNYDYWSILRRFDPRYPEADFTYSPRFLSIDAAYAGDALKDFLEVLSGVDPALDWAEALGILRDFRGMELVSPEGWRTLLRSIGELKRSGILLTIVRLMDGDPSYTPGKRPPEGKLVETYVAAVRKQTESIVQRLLDAKRQKSVARLTQLVFGDVKLPQLSNYTESWDELMGRKSLAGFAHTRSLALAKAYLIEVHKTRVKEVVDALLIRGKWRETGLSRSLSDAYQETLAVLPELLEFDRKLGENQELGVRVKAALTRADRAKTQSQRPARQLIEQVDRSANAYVTRTAQGCVALGQILRALIEDASVASAQILMNWRELKGGKPEEDLREQLVATYRRLQGLVQLLKLTMSRTASSSPPKPATDSEAPNER